MDNADKKLLRGACVGGAREALKYPSVLESMLKTENTRHFIWGYVAAIREGRVDITEHCRVKEKYFSFMARDPWAILEFGLAVWPGGKNHD